MDKDSRKAFYKADLFSSLVSAQDNQSEEFLSLVIENFILKILDEEQRGEFFKFIETNSQKEEILNFLIDLVPNFEHKLNVHIREEIDKLINTHA